MRTYINRNRRWLSAVIAGAVFVGLPELAAVFISSLTVTFPVWLNLLVLVILSGYLGYALMTTPTRSAKIIRYLGSAVAIAIIAHAFLP